jgi:hypothetical protein
VIFDSSNPAQADVEKRFVQVVKDLRVECKVDKSEVPIFSYHYDQPSERQFWEKQIGLNRSNLVCIGLATRVDEQIKTVLQQQNHVSEPNTQCAAMFRAMCVLYGIAPPVLPPPHVVGEASGSAARAAPPHVPGIDLVPDKFFAADATGH